MIRRGAIALSVVAATGAFALGGCITLFPKEPPSTLFRFGDHVQPAQASGPGVGVRTGALGFDQAAAGDAIMTVSDNQIAYIAGSRWAMPAQTMFAAAVKHGFAGGGVRLIGPGDPGTAQYVLKLDVGRFEARYDHGAASAPTIVVRMHASLVRVADQAFVGGNEFDAEVPAADNRVGPIADAFDQATTQVVSGLVTWVDTAPAS